jgi:hypothetical protein
VEIQNKLYSTARWPSIIFLDTPYIQMGWEVTEHDTAPMGQTRQKWPKKLGGKNHLYVSLTMHMHKDLFGITFMTAHSLVDMKL